jgi:oligopeptide/dipeptide ABC transporter ATP-binding protein
MYLGKFMEIGYADIVIDEPKHPYAKALRAAIPVPDPCYKRNRVISENIREKSFQELSGCRYQIDCQYAMDICAKAVPPLRKVEDHHYVACHLY